MFKHNSLVKLTLSLGMVLSLIGVMGSSAVAQSRDNDQGYQSNEKDSTYGDAPAGLNPLDLMHRAQQLNGRSSEEFNQESQAQLNNSALDFKRLQQQRILEMQQQSATTPEASVEKESVE